MPIILQQQNNPTNYPTKYADQCQCFQILRSEKGHKLTLKYFYIQSPMKKNYMTPTKKAFKKAQEQIQTVLDQKINDLVDKLDKAELDANPSNIEKLHQLLMRRKKVSPLSKATKERIFRMFLTKELKELNFLRIKDKFTLKLLNITKTKLKGLTLNWREVIEKFESSSFETLKVAGFYDFLVLLRPYYNHNNALEVIDYFQGRYSFSSQMTWLYLEKFVYINHQTDITMLAKFLIRLRQFMEAEDVKDIHLWRWIVKLKKKAPLLNVEPEIKLLNGQLIKKLLQIQNKEKGDSQVLSTQFLGKAFSNLIGKQNPQSCYLITMFFQTFKNSLVAFQAQNKSILKFLSVFLLNVSERKQAEDKIRKRITKIEQTKEDEQEQSEKQSEDQQEDSDEISSSNILGNYVFIEQSEQSEKEDEDDKQQKDKQKILKKLQLKLVNQITPQILVQLKLQLQKYLQDIFFIQSKVSPKLFRYIFKIFPDLVQKTVPFISKGVEVPELNVPFLMKNSREILKNLVQHHNRHQLLQIILDILTQILKIRYIKDGWCCIDFLVSCIPLLDQEDFKTTDAEEKKYFQKHFQTEHDKFYQKYSELVFQAFKRYLRENQAKQKMNTLIGNPFNNFTTNSYKEFDKRCVKFATELYAQTQSLFIHHYLQTKKLSPGEAAQFCHDILTGFVNQNLQRKIEQLLFSARSGDFEQVKRCIELVARTEVSPAKVTDITYRLLEVWIQQNISLRCSMRPLSSSLQQIIMHDKKGEIYLANHHKQHAQDKVKLVVGYWKQCYNYVNAYIDSAEHQGIRHNNISQTVKAMHFGTAQIDFNARRELSWRLTLLKSILESLPYHRRLVSTHKHIKHLQFEEFPCLQGLKDQAVKLLQKLLRVSLNKYPHDQQLLSILKQFLQSLLDGFQVQLTMWVLDMKDIRKQLNKQEDFNRTNYYLKCAQNTVRIEILNHAIAYANRTPVSTSLQQAAILLALHPDEKKLSSVLQYVDTKLALGILREVTQIQLAEDVDENKKKRFLTRIAQVINDYVGFSKIQLNSEEFLYFSNYCVQLSGFGDKKVREAHLTAVKALMNKLQSTRIDPSALEQRVHKSIKSDNNKQKLIWCMFLLIAYNSHKKINLEQFNKQVAQLLFSQDYLMRKAALFVNSMLIKNQKAKSLKIVHQKDFGEYPKRTLLELHEKGYLRPQHENVKIVRKLLLERWRAYDECQIHHKTVPKQVFEFISSPEKCLQFLKTYQTDQISSQDQLMLLTKKISTKDVSQLSQILTFSTKKFTKYAKLSKHKFSIYERMYGERLFKYLFQVDSSTGYRFWSATKDFIKSCVHQIQTLDNQIIVMNYSSMLMDVYSRKASTEPNKDIQNFFIEVLGELMQKAPGKFWTIYSELVINRLQSVPDFLRKYFESIEPSSPSYFRAVQKLLSINIDSYNRIMELLRTMLQNPKANLGNPVVMKIIKTLIKFSAKHYVDGLQTEKSKIIDIKALQAQKKVIPISANLYIQNTEDFHQYYTKTLSKLVQNESIDIRKSASQLLFQSITITAQQRKSQNSLRLLDRLLFLAVQWITKHREQVKIEHNPLVQSFTSVLSEAFSPEDFKLLTVHIQRLLVPQTQATRYLDLLYKYPYNFIRSEQKDYHALILKIVSLIQNPLLFKDVLLCISGLFYYRKLGEGKTKLQHIKQFTPNQKYQNVILMAVLLAELHNLKGFEAELQYVLDGPGKQKDKIKIWAKLMVDSRGKATQLIQEDQTKKLWSNIKSVSNPFFYHA